MAKTKSSSQQHESNNHQEKSKPTETSKSQPMATSTIEDQSEKLKSLKSLNSLLIKETIERREAVDTLQKAKDHLEVQIEKIVMEKQSLEEEKSNLEEMSAQAEIEKRLMKVFVEEQIEKLKEEKVREVEQVSEDFRGYMVVVQKELDGKKGEVDRLKSEVEELENRNVRVEEELRSVTDEKNRSIRSGEEIERKFGELRGEMTEVVKKKGEIEKLKKEGDVEINRLKMEVEFLNADLTSEKFNLEGVVSERDRLRKDLDGKIEEVDGLKFKIGEVERSNLGFQNEVMRVQKEKEGLFQELKERTKMLESALEEKSSLEKSLLESSRLIEDLKGEVEVIGREKGEIDHERRNQVVKITELESEIGKLSGNLEALGRKEEGLQGEVDVLEKKNMEGLKKHEELQSELGKLVKEREMIIKQNEIFSKENKAIAVLCEEIECKLRDQTSKLGEILQEKAEIEEVKVKREMEIAELHKETSELKETISKLHESCRDQAEINNKLQSEATEQKAALESITFEKDAVQKEEEKLRLEVVELEKRFGEIQHKLEQERMTLFRLSVEKEKVHSALKQYKDALECVTAERDEVLKEVDLKKKLEGKLTLEVAELGKKVEELEEGIEQGKLSRQKILVEAEEDQKNLLAKVKSAEMRTYQALQMLKMAGEMVSGPENTEIKGNGESGIDREYVDEEIQPFKAELEAIKEVFKSKELKVSELKQQLERLQCSLVEKQKKRSFWSLFSSATALLAAVSAGYIARGRQ